MPKLRNAIPRPGYRLLLGYDDGTEGEVDLSSLAGRGVFAAWNDPAVFDSVSVGCHGEVRWSEEIELCGDALYLQLTGKSAEEAFPNLGTSADA